MSEPNRVRATKQTSTEWAAVVTDGRHFGYGTAPTFQAAIEKAHEDFKSRITSGEPPDVP